MLCPGGAGGALAVGVLLRLAPCTGYCMPVCALLLGGAPGPPQGGQAETGRQVSPTGPRGGPQPKPKTYYCEAFRRRGAKPEPDSRRLA